MAEAKKTQVGTVVHYYGNAGVAVVDLTKVLKVGDKISIVGENTDVQQTVESMQLEHTQIEKAKKGDSVGLKVDGRVGKNSKVFKV